MALLCIINWDSLCIGDSTGHSDFATVSVAEGTTVADFFFFFFVNQLQDAAVLT